MAVATRGSVVLVMAGHDKGRYHTILEIGADGCFVLADGKLRTLEKPKRKNPKHVKVMHKTLSEAELCTDRQIRRALHPYNYGEQELL